MTRTVIHNYMTRNIGSFRAIGGAKDHKDCGCGCGGHGDCNHSHDNASAAKAELGIDVNYKKGGAKESRHYSVPSVLVDPHGQGPNPAAIAELLRRQPGHVDMTRNGWAVAKADGYYKKEQRDVSSKRI